MFDVMSDALDWLALPPGFTSWNPLIQGSALAALALVTEDGVTFGAALLSAAGLLQWQTAFWGTFLGIWIGDIGLYALARRWGRPLIATALFRRFLDPQRLAAGEAWFQRRGAWALLASRVLPGTRLPAYLAAGLLRMPFLCFALVTGFAALTWSITILALTHRFGSLISETLQATEYPALVFAILLAILIASWSALRRLLTSRSRFKLLAWMGRWRHWEFWPSWLFYAPVAVYYVGLALRHRGFTLPTAANPGITHGGMVGESKYATLQELMTIAPELTARSLLLGNEDVQVSEKLASLERWIREQSLEFPVVLKPDLGQRGVGVKVVRDLDTARAYLNSTRGRVLVQPYIPGPFEAGLFYVRRPGESRGRLFAITEKVFPCLHGDGKHTIEELIWRDARARCVADKYLRRLGRRRNEIPAEGESIRLVEAGNHAQGCIFRDGRAWGSAELEARIDAISRELPGFFFGRYDVRFSRLEDLRAGKGFQILELNGAASEATSIYDAKTSLIAAYRVLFEQWRLAFEIGEANRRLGHEPTPLHVFIPTWRQAAAHFAACPVAD